MPDQTEQEAERKQEESASQSDIDARLRESDGHGSPWDYRDAGNKWEQIAKQYDSKADGATDEDDELDYICRAAAAWAKAAADFLRASLLLDQDKVKSDEYKGKANKAYTNAAKLYETCIERRVERGEFLRARPVIEQADNCYLHLGSSGASKRLRKMARLLKKWIEQSSKGEPLDQGDPGEDYDE